MKTSNSVPLMLLVAALLAHGCGRDEEETASGTSGSSETGSAIKDFVPPIDDGAGAPAGSTAPSDGAVAEVPQESVMKAGQLLDQSISVMRDLSLMVADIKDQASATDAAPKITEKVAALNTINEETKVLGMTEEQGQKLFPEKYQQLKQMSLLLQGHMQRLSLDVPIYRTVSDAWQQGQSGSAPASGTTGPSGSAPPATPEPAAEPTPSEERSEDES